ncbi:MAG: taurine dioxygenase, partial [Pseudomonadales bacterium]|nr:taurine dioxygenase [Pseudomonadales bacterium]
DSIAMWDNRITQHKPVNDYWPAHRRMQRITIDGDRPF